MDLKFQIGWAYKGKVGSSKIWVENQFAHPGRAGSRTIRSIRILWRRIIAEVLNPETRIQFQTEGAAGQESWQTLAGSTIRERARMGLDAHPILQRSTYLMHSFLDKGDADHVEEMDDDSLVWGSRNPYAAFHQTGTGKGYKNRRPARGKGTGRGTAMRPIIDIGETYGDQTVNRWSSAMRRIFLDVAARDAKNAGLPTRGEQARMGGFLFQRFDAGEIIANT